MPDRDMATEKMSQENVCSERLDEYAADIIV